MNLTYWKGLTIYVLMVETTDGMSDDQSMTRQAGAGHHDAHLRTSAMKHRLDGLHKAIESAAQAIGEEAALLSEPVYSIVPSPLGTEPGLIAAWRCKGGMNAVASTIPLPHLEDASISIYTVDQAGVVIPV